MMRSWLTRSSRRGVTLIEMIIALFLFVTVFAVAVPFFRFQARSVMTSAGRLDALQNARYAQNAIDRDLRIAGIGVVATQPLIVQADPYAVTFNGDLATKDPADPGSIYYDPDVDSLSTISLPNTSRITLPRSAVGYPDSNYFANSIPSRAETVSYWVSQDSTAGRPDQYILFRRVNAAPAHVVAKGLIIPAGQAFFTYFRPVVGGLDSIRTSQLPIYHTAPIHGSLADTGRLAWVDSIRVVRVQASGLYKDPQKGDVIRSVTSSTKLLNAGMLRTTTCGDTPLPASAGVATPDIPLAPTKVTITWAASLDQDAGEKDVERYLIFKRNTGSPDWGEPIADISASQPTYSLDDTNLSSGSWVYGIVAQDCSPANSSMVTTAPVVIP